MIVEHDESKLINIILEWPLATTGFDGVSKEVASRKLGSEAFFGMMENSEFHIGIESSTGNDPCEMGPKISVKIRSSSGIGSGLGCG